MTRWLPEARARAIGLALAVGADKASAQTGVPRRTISSWLGGERPAPELAAMAASSREQVAQKLWEAVTVGTEAVLAGLRDPKSRLGDKANALRIVAEQYALLTGGATSRSENLNLNANWQDTDDYRNAAPELQQQSAAMIEGILHELVMGYSALKLAGAPEAGLQVDGLSVRADLDPESQRRVRYLLSVLEDASGAGVSAADIIASLTAKQLGDGRAAE